MKDETVQAVEHKSADSARKGRFLPEMDDGQFEQWAALLQQRAGVQIPPQRRSFLATGLGLRMRELGIWSYAEYFQQLTQTAAGKVEWFTLVDRLTVHETRFFRHPAALDTIRREIQRVRSERGADEAVHIFSAGCSTGEEAYTLGMVADQETLGSGLFSVTGADISQPSVQTAQLGEYSLRRTADVPPELHAAYFERLGGDIVRIIPSLHKRVCFLRLNFVDFKPSALRSMDIIFCQNLLIYFDRSMRERTVERLVECLRPGGLLILGPGELVGWKHSWMTRVADPQVLAYRRTEDVSCEKE